MGRTKEDHTCKKGLHKEKWVTLGNAGLHLNWFPLGKSGSYPGKKDHTWSELEKWVTLRNVGDNQKNWSHLEKRKSHLEKVSNLEK